MARTGLPGRPRRVLLRAIEQRVTITPYRDGPLLVRGPIELLAAGGKPISSDHDPIALCRCGRSKRKPFCDGTHKLVGFRARGVNG